ncbi:MAG: ribose-phosphate pyrophosphokinase [Erysipelotrichaceae bacterium]|nr:ribose-phosphate pyrophosphokinase [Erysipelotrichaceae bacterium]
MKDTMTMVFGLTANLDLVNEICEYLKIKPGKISVSHFADGEILVEPEESVRGKRVYLVQSSCKPTTEHLMEILIAVDAFRRASAREITCIMPYFGYARQDRKARPRQPITSKLVADLISTAGADRVVMFDLHAAQIQGFFNCPTDNLTTIPMMGAYFKRHPKIKLKNTVVVSPDHGGTTRARTLAEILEVPLAIVDKRRPQANVAVANDVIGDVAGKDCIVVDDICDTGGSLVASCDILKDKGAKDIYVAIAHPVFSGNAVEKIHNSCIKEMVVSNTIPLSEEAKKYKKIKVVSVGKLLAGLIDAISNNTPVSEIYNFKDHSFDF